MADNWLYCTFRETWSVDLELRVQQNFQASIEIKQQSMPILAKLILEANTVMVKALLNGNKLLCCGNGGSAANAQHFSAKLLNRFASERPDRRPIIWRKLTMKNSFLVLITILLALNTACTTVLVGTTGDDGMQEDPGKRTAGAVLEDSSIETRIKVNLRVMEPEFKNAHFDVISHNGVVLLVGQVQSEQMKSRATEIAADASTKIKRIHNELEVSGKIGFIARNNDNWIATKVRTQLFADGAVPSDQVRVITENGSVYLMGMVSQQQGDEAAALTRNISGVTRVVKVFEYIN